MWKDAAEEGKRTWSEGKQAKYEAEYHRQIIEKLMKLAEYEKISEQFHRFPVVGHAFIPCSRQNEKGHPILRTPLFVSRADSGRSPTRLRC